jgi:hypothetical protein
VPSPIDCLKIPALYSFLFKGKIQLIELIILSYKFYIKEHRICNINLITNVIVIEPYRLKLTTRSLDKHTVDYRYKKYHKNSLRNKLITRQTTDKGVDTYLLRFLLRFVGLAKKILITQNHSVGSKKAFSKCFPVLAYLLTL